MNKKRRVPEYENKYYRDIDAKSEVQVKIKPCPVSLLAS